MKKPASLLPRPPPVEHPDDGEVLDVVEDLEEGHAEHRVGHVDRAPPPETEGHGGRQELDRVLALPGKQIPARPEDEDGGEGEEGGIEGASESEEDRG